MKLNWAERLVVNNPLRVIQQRLEIQWLKQRVSLENNAAALEIGCGRGAGAKLILHAFRPASLFTMDLDIQMGWRAKSYLSAREYKRINFSVGDAHRLPIKTNMMDAVFGFGILHHVPHWQGAASEIARILKPKGLFFFEELYPATYQNAITRRILLHPRKNRFQSLDLHRVLNAVGFTVTDTFEIKKLGILGIAKKARRFR